MPFLLEPKLTMAVQKSTGPKKEQETEVGYSRNQGNSRLGVEHATVTVHKIEFKRISDFNGIPVGSVHFQMCLSVCLV